jgi:hypothetical protein
MQSKLHIETFLLDEEICSILEYFGGIVSYYVRI